MLYALVVVTEAWKGRKAAAQILPLVPVRTADAAPVRFVHYPERSAYLTALANARALTPSGA